MDYQFQLRTNSKWLRFGLIVPEVHNAFNTEVIEELHACFQS